MYHDPMDRNSLFFNVRCTLMPVGHGGNLNLLFRLVLGHIMNMQLKNICNSMNIPNFLHDNMDRNFTCF